ncbi:MAG: MCP four helix bundle domain-containing protein [Adhaeribacter sp.]
MKWMYGMEGRNTPAVLMLIIVVTILISNFLEKKFMTDMGKSLSSIYQDRLVPAAGLFQINDLMFTRRLTLEEYLLKPEPQRRDQVSRELGRHSARIDSLIRAYEATYLVAEESRQLGNFKQKVHQYRALESRYLSGTLPENQWQNFAREIGPLFKQMHGELMALSHIQTVEGAHLLEGSRAITGKADLIGNLQIALVVVIVLAVQALLRRSRALWTKKMQNFRLN